MNRFVWNPWPTTPAAIRAASRIGARPASLFHRLRPALARLGDAFANLAVLLAALTLFAALYASR